MKSPHLDRDWLYQKYIVEGLSTYDIAKIVHRDPKNIYQKLIDFEIPTRPRGLNLRGEDNYMRTSGAITPFKGRFHTEETKRILSEKASKPKPYLQGKNNGMFGRIGNSNPNWKNGCTPERQSFYVSQEWKIVRQKVWKRDKATCRRCNKRQNKRGGYHIHHIVSFAVVELRAKPDNLILLCENCHTWVHSNLNTSKEFLG